MICNATKLLIRLHKAVPASPWNLDLAILLPAMRRYDAKAAMWQCWATAYPNLYAIDYLSDRMLSLDFGSRQFVIEGRGLDLLARYLQLGTVLKIVEYAEPVWPEQPYGPLVTAIKRVGQ